MECTHQSYELSALISRNGGGIPGGLSRIEPDGVLVLVSAKMLDSSDEDCLRLVWIFSFSQKAGRTAERGIWPSAGTEEAALLSTW